MTTISTGRALRSLRRAAWFSLVTAPAIALFTTFVLFSFNNSLAGTFLDEARSLVAGTPPGKVWACAPSLNTAEEGPVPVPPVAKPLCEPVMTDADIWQQSTDRSLRDAYKFLVIMGAFIWWFFNGMAGFKDTARWVKDKVVRPGTARRAGQGGQAGQDKE